MGPSRGTRLPFKMTFRGTHGIVRSSCRLASGRHPDTDTEMATSPALTDPSSWDPKLLEREREQKQLDALIRDACRAEGGAVLIEGGAGVGKSRLLDYVRARASRAGMRTLSARASE